MMSQDETVAAIFSRVHLLVRRLRQNREVEAMVLAPASNGLDPRFFVLIDSPALIVQIAFWNRRILELEARSLQTNATLLDCQLPIRHVDEIDPYLETVLKLFQEPAPVRHTRSQAAALRMVNAG